MPAEPDDQAEPADLGTDVPPRKRRQLEAVYSSGEDEAGVSERIVDAVCTGQQRGVGADVVYRLRSLPEQPPAA